MERYTVTWEGELRQQQVIEALPPDPVDDQDELIYWDRIMEADAAWRWETLEIDMGTVSRAFPGVLFRVEIEKVDEHTRHVQHHRDGQYYEAQEIRELPWFEPDRMVNTPPDPAMLDLDTPIVQVQVPTIRDVLTSFLEEAERDFVEIHTELAQPAGSRTALSVDQLLYALPHLRRAASSMVLRSNAGEYIRREIEENHMPAFTRHLNNRTETQEMQELDAMMADELELRKATREADAASAASADAAASAEARQEEGAGTA